ncbi:MAG: transcriptional regulator, partial [Lautropia sp.]
TRDPVLAELLKELSAFPVSAKLQTTAAATPADQGGIFVPLTLVTKDGVLSLLSTTTVFGTPRDIVLAELAIEAFFPANAQTRNHLEHPPHHD